MANLASFRSQIANRLGLDNSTTGDQPNIDGWVNDGVTQLLMDTHCYVTTATINGFDGSNGDFTLPVTVLDIVTIYPTLNGINYGMEKVSVTDLLEMRRYAPTAASPTVFFALAGHNLLMFHPVPASTDTMTMYYVPVPTALSASADDPSNASYGGIPSAWHKAIEYFACAEAADANDDQSSQMGLKYFQLYEDQVKKIRRELRRRGGMLGQKAIVGPRGPRGRPKYVRHSNSIYP